MELPLLPELCTLLTVKEFELPELGGGQFLGCTTTVDGALVGCTEVGTLQLLGCTTAVLGALAGCNTLGLAQLADEGKRPAEPKHKPAKCL